LSQLDLALQMDVGDRMWYLYDEVAAASEDSPIHRSTITTFGTPRDVTLDELWIECAFPAVRQRRTCAVRSRH
jgi:hypothetical protein